MQSYMKAETIVEAFWSEAAVIFNIPAPKTKELLQELLRFYGEEHRCYHTSAHLADMLELCQAHKTLIRDQASITLAVLYHDVIYNPRSASNEEDSAVLFRERFAGLLDERVLAKIERYILATKAHSVLTSEDSDLQLFIDFDMAVLGRSDTDYRRYSAAIRQEYAHFDDRAYCEGRAKALKGFLEGCSSIFATEIFCKEFESSARENIAKEIAELEAQLTA